MQASKGVLLCWDLEDGTWKKGQRVSIELRRAGAACETGPGAAAPQRVGAGAGVAYWAYTRGEPFLGIMFAMLAASCWQSLSLGGGPWRR